MASGTWTSVATSGVWSLATNWAGTTIADGSGFTANFTSNITATTTIDTTIGGGWSGTIGNIVFSDNGASGSTWTLGSQSTITLAGGTPTITATTAATINGILAGTAGLIKAGAQTLTLAGANTFSGSITINAGTLSVTTSASALGADTARALTVGSGNALSLGVATTRSSFSTSIAGTGVSTNGAIIIANTGTNNLGTITLAAASSIRASSSGNLAGTITNAGFALTLQAPSGTTGTFSGAITGLGGLVAGGTANAISQTGTVTLTSLTNSYSGDTTVSTGTLTVSGLLGSGSYAGNISIASGATFSFTSTSNQTLSGAISGLGTLTKVTGTSSILTLSGTNSYSALNIQAGTVSVASIANNVGSGVSAINVGLTATSGTLRYTGSGETTSKVINLAGNTTGGASIENNGTGALVFTSAITGVSASGTRTLTLQGSNAGVNDFQGVIADVGGGAGLTAFTKAGVGYWKLSGVNTFSGVNAAVGVSVTGGQIEIPALSALGSGTKTISITGTNRNGSMLLSGASVTYPATLSWSLNSTGHDQTNSPLGAIRARADSTIAGTVTLAGSSLVYADTGDLTFNGAISGTSTFFQARAAAGRTVTISGGFGNAGTAFSSIGPGTVVWNGSASNISTGNPSVQGGTLKLVTTTSTATPPVQFAFTGVTLGLAASQTGISSRYQYTGGTLEFSNSGAAGAVDYTGLTNTTAISLNRGSGKLKLSRDSTAGSFSVTLGNTTGTTPGSGVLTLEYAGTPGTIGTDSSIIFSALGPDAAYPRIIISDGAGSFVPAYFNASRVAVPMVYGSAQSNVAASQAGGTTLTLLSTAFGNYNLTGDITAQATASTSTLRLATSTGTPITLAAGANLQSAFLMDMGTGTARTIVAGATSAKLSRSIATGASNILGIWTENLTGTGATISADMDARFNSQLTKAGVGILTLSGKFENQSAMFIADGSVRIASTGTFVLPYAGMSFNNDFTNASGIEFNQTGEPVVSHLNGGGANTTLALKGGDLVLTNGAGTGTTGVFGGNVSLSASQKLKIRFLLPSAEANSQAFQGAFPFTAIEMSRGYISLDPQYGATVTGTPSVTVTGGSFIAIQAQNPLEADYGVAFGALSVNAGSLRVTLANSTSIGNPYNTRITAASLTVTGDSVVNLLAQSANAQQSFTISSVTTAGTLGNGVNVYNGGNIAYYRLAGQTLANSTVALVNTVDSPAYGTDANFSAIKTTGASFTSTGVNDNVSIATTAITAQNSVTVKSLRSAVNITMASSADRLTADLVVLAGTITLASGELATQTGSLYVNASSTSVISSKITNNGATLTKVILYTPSSLTLSGANDYSGGTVVNGGNNSVTLSGASPLGTGPIVGNGGAGFTIASGTLTLGATNTITLNDGGLRLDASTGAAYALNGAISGTGDLYLTGAGTFTLGAVGTGTGALRMSSSGTVTVNAAQAFTEYDFNNGSLTFRYSSGFTTDISAGITKRPGNTYRIDTNGQTITWASSVGNGSTYVKVGDGTHTLSAENFFATITIGNNNGSAACGTVVAAATNALGYGTVTVKSGNPGSTSTGTALYLSGNITLPNAFSVSGEGVIGTGLIHSISGSNTISGTVTLVGGVTSISRFSAAAGATLTLSGSVTTDSTRDVDFAGLGTTVVTGIIANGSVTNALSVQRIVGAGAGTTRLTAANTYTRGTNISEGTIQAGNVTALGAGNVTLGASGTLQTLTTGGQNGKLTITGTLTNSAGGTIRIGG